MSGRRYGEVGFFSSRPIDSASIEQQKQKDKMLS